MTKDNESEIIEILEEYDIQIKKDKNLTFFDLLTVLIIMCIIFLLTIPMIYIRNEIYYISRDISELKTKQAVLLEENRELKKKIEVLKLKDEIFDPLSIKIDE